jgi:hypothetical protein
MEPDLGRRTGAIRADVGMENVLATGAFGPGLPQPTPSRRAGDSGLAPVTHQARTHATRRFCHHRLAAATMRQANASGLPSQAPQAGRRIPLPVSPAACVARRRKGGTPGIALLGVDQPCYNRRSPVRNGRFG